MIFVNSTSELEYYNSSTVYGCYGDAIFNPNDILLQANTFIVMPSVITINVCDLEGAVQDAASTDFSTYIAKYVLGGVTYFFVNIRCENYTAYMLSNRCFVVNVVIEDGDGNEIFNKYTQKYQIVTEDAPVFVPSILIDDIPTAPCIPGSNPALCTSGGTQYVKFATSFECYDAYTGDYYDLGIGIEGTPFAFVRYSYIAARFRDVPTEIERIISINNRTQKTAYTGQYLFRGNVPFPVWKMKEIQNMFRGSHLYVDDTLFQSDGGVLFKQLPGLPVNCIYHYQFEAAMHSDYQWQQFGCVPDCASLATYYMFPDAFERVYDDGMRGVASDVDSLLLYFESLAGVTNAEELTYALPCSVYALLKVEGTAILPKFLYVDQPIASQRIYPKPLSVTTTDFSSLCNGVTNTNQVPVPDVTGEYDTEIQVAVPDISSVEDVDATQYTPSFTTSQGWQADLNYTNAVSYSGVVTLNISVSTTDFTSPFTNMVLGTLEDVAWPTRDMIITDTDNGNMPPSSSLYISAADGTVTYTGDATWQSGNEYRIELFTIQYDL